MTRKKVKQGYQQPKVEVIFMSKPLSVLQSYSLWNDVEDYEVGEDL